jgi:cellulose biosynthesis protein BcsQ
MRNFIFINQYEEFSLLNTILRQRVDYDKALWNGQSILEYTPKSKATNEFKDLVYEDSK